MPPQEIAIILSLDKAMFIPCPLHNEKFCMNPCILAMDYSR